jgi:cardiolipin synthase (CMP-forming)
MARHPALVAIPNAISASRLVLAAAFVVSDDSGTRLGLVVAAAITDFLDGFIARRAQISTRFGALLDPVADRVFALAAVSVLLYEGSLGVVGYFVIIFRDIMTAIGFLVARIVPWLRPIEFRARMAGKVVTVLQLAALVALLRQPPLVNPLLVALGVAGVVATVDYTLMLWRERTR